MKNLLHFPNRRRAEEQAALWITRLDRGLSAAERDELEQWLSNPVNHAAFVELEDLWRTLDVMSDLAPLFPVDKAQSSAAPRRVYWRAVAATAVAVATVAAAGALLLERPNQPVQVVSAPRPSIHVTAVGGFREVMLEDGSTLLLNTDTRVRATFSASLRALTLDRGEVYFDVAHDPSRPFLVRVGAHALEAVGTAFNVERAGEGIELIVTEGRVRVLVADDDTAAPDPVLTAGERGRLGPEGFSVSALATTEADTVLAWQRGMLIFDEALLADVLAEFGRYSTARLSLADATLGDIRVGGYFRAGDVDALLAALSGNLGIEAERRDGEIILKRR